MSYKEAKQIEKKAKDLYLAALKYFFRECNKIAKDKRTEQSLRSEAIREMNKVEEIIYSLEYEGQFDELAR